MSRLGDVGCSGDFQESTNKKKMMKKKKTKWKKKVEEEEDDDDDDDGKRRVAARKRYCRRSYPKTLSSQTSWPSGLPGRVPPPASPGSRRGQCCWPALEASRVPILGSVGHCERTLYLASRRPRASAAPQPPVNSQLTPTRK